MRHGESRWNAERRFQGWGGPGLTERGHREAKEVARFLGERVGNAALLVRSDIVRVEETAAPIEEVLGVRARVDRRWREIDVGSWSGRTFEDLTAEAPDDLLAWRRGEDIEGSGAERFADLRVRVRTALGDAARAAGRGVAVVVTHGGPIRAAVALALGLPGEASLAGVGNCSTTELEIGDRGASLVVYGSAGHLSDDGGGSLTG